MTVQSDSPNPLVIDVWSDIMCPFCYLGDALLSQALARVNHGDAAEVRYHSYQLMPGLPTDRAVGVAELLVREKGLTPQRVELMNAQIAERGQELGLEFRFDRARVVNTRAAHRLSHVARQEGKQRELMVRLFEAYFTRGLHLGQAEVLTDLAAQVGLDRAAVAQAIAEGAFDADVAADQRAARELGIQGVPFFVINQRYAVSGAQPVDVFLEALEAAQQQLGR